MNKLIQYYLKINIIKKIMTPFFKTANYRENYSGEVNCILQENYST